MEIKRKSFSGMDANIENVNKFLLLNIILREDVITITESGNYIVLYYWGK